MAEPTVDLRMLAHNITAITKGAARPIVSVCGHAGTGKSTTTNAMLSNGYLAGAIIQLDWYLRYATPVRKQRIADALKSGDTERIEAEENPLNWYDWNRYQSDINHLQTSGTFEMHDAWDQSTGLKELQVGATMEQDGFIICEGIYLLHPPIVEQADVTILMTLNESVARARAKARDAHRSDAQYLAYKQCLVEKYDNPYMTRFAPNATLVFSVGPERQ